MKVGILVASELQKDKDRSETRDRGSESGGGHRGSSCKAEPGREGKEEQRAE